jgi:rhomboid protease GluP
VSDEEPILITPEMLAPARPRDDRIDFERGMRRMPRLILALVLVNVVVFGWEVASGAFLNSKEAIEAGRAIGPHLDTQVAGALVRERVLAGEWWRMITATFLHGGFDHLIGNMIVLWIVGMACEHAFGAAKTAIIYFGSAVAGTAFSMLNGPGPSVGASGAIFGVLMAVVVMLYRNQKYFFVRDKRIGFVLLAWAGWSLFTGLMAPYVDNFAHVGGMAGGALAGLLLAPTLTTRR